MSVAVVHDYLTQRGGAERVVLSLLEAFPGAPLHTSLYEPALTFPEFRQADVRTSSLNKVPLLRRHHRLALPLLARSFSGLELDADVAVCSSSGWAHGARTTGQKVVYCHTPARWLYQPDRYLGDRSGPARAVLSLIRPRLERWDRCAAASADRYLANSTVVQARIREIYGLDAEVVPAPYAVDPSGEQRPVPGLDAGFALCVSRLLPYKNVPAVVEAFSSLPGEQLVIVGAGPGEQALTRAAPPNVRLLGTVSDEELRWLYAHCRAVVGASFEDYGLTPVEGAAFGKPAAVLRWGGYLDTVVEDETGVFFDAPRAADILEALRRVFAGAWNDEEIRLHAGAFSRERFCRRLREIVAEEGSR